MLYYTIVHKLTLTDDHQVRLLFVCFLVLAGVVMYNIIPPPSVMCKRIVIKFVCLLD